MNELINLVVQRTGLSSENAQKAVEAVIDILKQRLPAPLAAHVDSMLGGAGGATGAEASDMLKGAVGGLFGGQK